MIKSDRIKILDQGNCDFVRDRGKEAYVKSTSLRTETFYKAGVVGELAPHSETHDSTTQVKNEVAGRRSIHLPGEASVSCALGCNMPIKGSGSVSNARVVRRGVSRDHSSLETDSGELKRLTKTENPRFAQTKDRTEEVETTGESYE